MVTGAFLLSAISFLAGIIGIVTIWPAIINLIFNWFSS